MFFRVSALILFEGGLIFKEILFEGGGLIFIGGKGVVPIGKN